MLFGCSTLCTRVHPATLPGMQILPTLVPAVISHNCIWCLFHINGGKAGKDSLTILS